MSDASLWWIVSGALVALEMFTLTFYLLMLAVGAAAGALAAHLGLSQTGQIAVAAIVSCLAVLACYLVRRPRPGDPSPRAERSVNLDVGETVQIERWQPDGTASVRYRGTQWTAIHPPGLTPQPGPHRVTELVGSRLLVEPL